MLIKQHIAEIQKLRLEALYSTSGLLEDVEELSAEEPAGEEQPELLQYEDEIPLELCTCPSPLLPGRRRRILLTSTHRGWFQE